MLYCKQFAHSMDGRHGDGSWMLEEGIVGVPVWIVRGLCVYARVTLHSLFRRKNSTAAIDVSLKANLFISDVQSPRHVYMSRGELTSC